MGGEFALIVLLVVGLPAILAIWLIVRAVSAGNRIEELTLRVHRLESELIRLRAEHPAPATAEALKAALAPAPEMEQPPSAAARAPQAATIPPVQPAMPPPIPVMAAAATPFEPAPEPVAASTPPPEFTPVGTLGQSGSDSSASPYKIPQLPAINWEQFMGVKLFAWVGGLALFLGVAFFVKYSFDNDLIPPELRVALGFLAGLGALVGGLYLFKKDYQVLSQTLCATGVVILYAVTFSCRSVYKFEFFDTIPTFLLMVLITATAFFLAVRLNALVVAVLGMLGGFLTPILLSTGQDSPFGLFGYIAILDAGLILVALNRRWHYLMAGAALGTILMQLGWANEFFNSERYFEGNKILIAMAVFLVFPLLNLAGVGWAKRRDALSWWLLGSTLALGASALVATGVWLDYPTLASRPWLMLGYLFLVDAAIAALVLLDTRSALAQPLAGVAVFIILAAWIGQHLTNDLLNPALVFLLVFAGGHSVFPIALQRRRQVAGLGWATQLFPPLALVLVLIPILRLPDLSFLVWPFVLVLDLLAIVLAAVTASFAVVLAVLLLSLGAIAALIFKIPVTSLSFSTPLVLVAVFAIFFVAASLWILRRYKPEFLPGRSAPDQPSLFFSPDVAAQLPVLSAVLPFTLLILITARLALVNPSPVFGLGLLLLVLVLGLAKFFKLEWMPAVGLACVAALEYVWHFNRYNPAEPLGPLVWYLVFLGVFLAYPFAFARTFAATSPPWAAAALVGLPQFYLVYRLVEVSYPNDKMGLVPAAFALPALGALVAVLKHPALTESPRRMTLLAWFGGVGLFFITLIFPIQFENQWLTLAWALEGVALLWLFHRVPHPGLRVAACGLLAAAFVRLMLNPAVLEYQLRSETALFNWYLYSYGIGTVCMFVGARLLAPPRNLVANVNVPPLLVALGTILAFALLNIEIADYFSEPGARLTFQFSGNFARDMTYSIAWALFALALLVIGIARRAAAARYAGLALLSVTLLKLFLHDLARLGQLYRIGAFLGVAIIAMLASFAYHRFFLAKNQNPASKNEPEA